MSCLPRFQILLKTPSAFDFDACNLVFAEPTPPADSDAIVPVCLGVLECVTQVVCVTIVTVMRGMMMIAVIVSVVAMMIEVEK